MSDFTTTISAANRLLHALKNPLLKRSLSTFGENPDLEDLKDTVETLFHELLANSDKALTRSIKYYIHILKDILYDADDLVDKLVTQAELKEQLRDGDRFGKVRCFCSSKNPLIAAWSVSQGVKDINKRLNAMAADIGPDKFKDDIAEFGFGFPDVRTRDTPSSYIYADNVIGREDDARKIVDRLLKSTDDVGFLTIVGMGGLGKTALVQLVYNDELIASAFELRSWVCVSDQDGASLGVKKILLKIIESDYCNFDLILRTYRHNVVGKKILLVLDDVWTEDQYEWIEMRRYLMMAGKGSRIIVTTRSRKTADIIGNDTHELKGLSDENSWCLFKKMAFEQGIEPLEFVEIGQKIVKLSCNNPLAIRVTSSLLYGKSIDRWHALLKDLDGSANDNDFDRHNPTIPILKLSYDHLHPYVQICFSYCAVFPKDYVIKKEMLMTLWEAQGYIIPLHQDQSIEDAGDEYFTMLLQRCFFQDIKMNECGNVESFKLHDLMHDLAQSVSGKEVCIINSSLPKVESSVRHLFQSTFGDSIIDGKIRSYLKFQKRWCFEAGSNSLPAPLSKIAKKHCSLRALALQGLRVSSFPDTMGNLLHLRYLNLAKNSMKKLPDSIAKLHNLQTLNINKCDELKKWPKGFSKLVNLKHLYRENCYELRCMPVGMSKLTRLRVLTDFVVHDESVGGMTHVGQLKDLKALSVNLKNCLSIQFHVNFTSSGPYDWEGSCLEEAKHLKRVEIGFSFPSQVLYQRRLDEERGPKEEAVMEKLRPHPNLRKFMLSHYAGYKITSWGQSKDNWAEASYLPNLVHIKISNCHRLQQLPLMRKLRHLKSLYLFDLKSLKYMEDEAIISNDSGPTESSSLDTTFFPSLESLEICELKQLNRWWRSCYSSQGHPLPAFPRLSQLTIENCPHLISFPICLSNPKLDLRNNNKRLRIRTGDEAQTSSSLQPPHPISSCP